MNDLRLSAIAATSPTLAEAMRTCPLRAGLSRTSGTSVVVLGNPKAWLGTAYHEVLEKILEVDLSAESIDDAIERLWSQSIATQHQRATLHPLDKRFGPPSTWPGYYVTRASVSLRAHELVAAASDKSRTIIASTNGRTGSVSIREQKFTAFNGKLVGRPDVIRAREIVDYKSGAIVELDEKAQADVVKAAYVRQLRIYGFLINEQLGWWPQRGMLFPSAGVGVEVALQPDDCTREAVGAVALLDEYNAKRNTSKTLDELASPSPTNCKWCPFKMVCQPFWESAKAEWSGLLDGAAVEGVLDEQPQRIHGGAAVSLSLQIDAGSEPEGQQKISPLGPNIYTGVSTFAIGERIRLVGLRVRPDRVLLPTQRTVVARISDLPDITLPANSNRTASHA